MTVGIVLVSHSQSLAEGTAELVLSLTAGGVRIVPAGGNSDGGLGSSPPLILDAVMRANEDGDGVLLIPDLGSAVMSARLLIDDLAEGIVALADAPFVEGAVAAGMAASTGGDLGAVKAAAMEAWSFRKDPE